MSAWWGLEPNDAVLTAALAGDDLATAEACRRGLGPELVAALRGPTTPPSSQQPEPLHPGDDYAEITAMLGERNPDQESES